MIGTVRMAACLLLLAALRAVTPAGQEREQSPATSTPLSPGVNATGSLGTAGVALYRIALSVDDVVEVDVSQPDVDLRVRLLDPTGHEVAQANLRRPQHGSERLHAIAGAEGEHLLRVELASGITAPDAQFTIALAPPRPAATSDRTSWDAARAYAGADTEMGRGGGDALRSAAASFQQAAEQWTAVGARFEAATALNRLGLARMQLSDLRNALVVFDESLRLRRDIGDRYGEGVVLNNLGATHNRLGDYDKAQVAYEQALHVRREVGDRTGVGWTLVGLGVVGAVRTGRWQTAVEQFEEASQLFSTYQDGRGEAEAVYMLGYAHKQLTDFDAAMAYFDRALTLRRAQKDFAGQATVLNQVTATYLQLGDPQRAWDLIDETLELRRRVGDRRGEAYTLQVSGQAATDLGNYTFAVERLSQALQLFETVGDREGQTSALAHLARVRLLMHEPEPALELAERARRVLDGRRNLMTTNLLSIIGDAQLALERYDAASASYTEALAESRRLGETLPVARALAGLGRTARGQGDLIGARRQLLEALALIESVRAGVSQQELRSSFLGRTQNAYEWTIDTLVALDRQDPSPGYGAEALAVSERRRARTLLETLAEARADLRSGADTALLEQEDSIQQQLNRRSAQRATPNPVAPRNVAPDAADGEIADLVTRLRSVRTEIRTRNPKYAALARPTPLDLAGVQRLLDPDTLLLEYSLGEDRGYLWAITATTMTLHELPARSSVEKAVVRARDLITQSMRRGVRGPMREALADLSAMILGPVAAELANKRLAIVADGVLQFLPFAALPHPNRARQGDGDEPLIVRHEIVILPSASTLDALREARPTRPATRKAVAVLADPVTQPSDPRLVLSEVEGLASAVPGSSSSPPPPTDRPDSGLSRDLTRAADALGVSAFERLPYSGDEAVAIAAKAGRSASLTALGFDATRELALSPTMGDFRVVHFATHTVLDTRHPELSGIVLTLIDRERQRVNGFLRLHDIFNMKLSADVVVLSACQTALGRDVRGEGLIGLTRGFMYAGAPQVVASLWNVRDRATATLMQELYAGLFERQLTPAAALRAAQVALWKNPRWRMPAYWAGFIVQGDWRQ